MNEHFAIGQQLQKLCDHGVLIVGSGNIVHNLRAMRMGTPSSQAYDWAMEFDKTTAGVIDSGNLAKLQDFQKMGQVTQTAHPYEHHLPLLHSAGAVLPGDPVRSLNTDCQMAAISMRSVVWG